LKELLTNIEAAKDAFRRAFGYTPPQVVQAPGRMELLGNHTDHCQGLVLAATINRYLVLTGAPRTDGKVCVYSSRFDEKQTFSRGDLHPHAASHWINYVKGLLSELRRRQISFPGFDLAVAGNLPAGGCALPPGRS
jgi:galactokinase